jgi:hypothetical protein
VAKKKSRRNGNMGGVFHSLHELIQPDRRNAISGRLKYTGYANGGMCILPGNVRIIALK